MRTIELREHEAKRERLAPDELDQVLATRLVGVSPVRGTPGEYELRPGSIAGTVVLKGVRLLIRPKARLENLFYMLGFGEGLVHWAQERFPFDVQHDLLEVVARMFEEEVGHALRGGIVRGYREHQEALQTVRGRIDVGAQIRARQGMPLPLESRFDELTADVLLNRVIRAGLTTLLRAPGMDSALVRALRFRVHSFADVAAVEYRASEVPEVPLTRLSAHWEHAAALARLVLSRRVLRDREGAVLGSAFTVDMNRLFERYVIRAVEAAAPPGTVVEPRAPRRLARHLRIRPDLLLRRHGRDVAVGEIKYKLRTRGRSRDDTYQLLAYCTALGLTSGLLVYAAPLPHQVHTVLRNGVRLERVGIDLGADRHALQRQVEEVARLLTRGNASALRVRQ